MSIEAGGEQQAFSLSLADVISLSGDDRAFPDVASRAPSNNHSWWLRTPGGPRTGWNSRHGEYGHVAGVLFGTGMANSVSAYRGIRPSSSSTSKTLMKSKIKTQYR